MNTPTVIDTGGVGAGDAATAYACSVGGDAVDSDRLMPLWAAPADDDPPHWQGFAPSTPIPCGSTDRR